MATHSQEWLTDIFKSQKSIVGVIHLPPLPGSSTYDGDFKAVMRRCLTDAEALEAGGVDGIIVENYGDAPFKPGRADPETVAAMSLLASETVKHCSKPVGVNILRNDAASALAVATLAGGCFIRVNVHTGAALTAEGLILGRSPETLQLRTLLKSDVKIFADVSVKHSFLNIPRALRYATLEATERGKADALIVTGRRTREPPALGEVKQVKKAAGETPVFVGSGLTPRNLALLTHADGAIVGSHFKVGGITTNPVDPERVKRFVEQVKVDFG
jgi:membrane complex biogenesis BtpA family protein